ncbi:zf-HC2 domain-containing protein [Desulfobacula sp.]|uniref:anti-sigma factor family protein n=1 Tax=Desulfobacula sp. TaxID=2593537 RepID=UPI00260E5459|nr:zf-HC2 domain-containing protein [Desulfobacula sp.]
MGKICNLYKPEEISRFVDNELPPDHYQKIAQHLTHCRDCNRLVEQYRSISLAFNRHADQQKLMIDPDQLTHKLALSVKPSPEKSYRPVWGYFGKNIYIKFASIAAILVISLFMFQGDLMGPSGPSAIVKSVDTDFASVMIIETQREKHTIIWFSET